MKRTMFSSLSLVLVALAWHVAAQEAVNPRAAVLSRFQERIDAYLELRGQALSGVKKLEETRNPEEVTARQRALADAIKAARPGAKAGEIFFPEVAALIKQAVSEDLKRRPARERAAAVTSVPRSPVVGVNDSYPSSIPLATVPAQLLGQLPRLPKELEYRFVGNRLILRDVDANLVVDFIENALPRTQGPRQEKLR